MVDRTALEMRHTGNRIGGSNPSLSANPWSQSVDFIGLLVEQIEAIPHSVPHSMGAGVGMPKTNFYF